LEKKSKELLDLQVLRDAWDQKEKLDLLGLKEMWEKLDLMVPEDKQD
jgi:hypothetical protein